MRFLCSVVEVLPVKLSDKENGATLFVDGKSFVFNSQKDAIDYFNKNYRVRTPQEARIFSLKEISSGGRKYIVDNHKMLRAFDSAYLGIYPLTRR